MSDSPAPAHTNRLAAETSPYLLQHAHNPVDWYPWGEEAFAAARAQDKPIFLSVGYSTCYWCHVMERESFEREPIAAEMNRRFINIKVDREERPDVDQLYMTAVQVLTRHGGWPMSVFLTPDLKPFYGGTYFPPTDNHGRPGFVTLLRGIEDAYRNRPADVKQTTAQLETILRQLAIPRPPRKPVTIDRAFVDDLVGRSTDDYDRHLGGFGSAPKFPRQTLLELLLVSNRLAPNEQRLRMVTHTLDALAHGGIRDQLGGGFHRYSTDARWLVPHFEIMLYDNAMLGWCYAEAHRQTADPRYAQVARDLFEFVLREMTSPTEGAFYTAFDAEVDTREGLTYLWTRDEAVKVLRAALGAGAEQAAEIERFCRAYGLDRGPNFADPHHGNGQPETNILYVARPGETSHEAAGGVKSVLLDPALRHLRTILLAARDQRKQPSLDTKVLTSWNALMIRALAHAGQALAEPRYVEAASRAARFLLGRHWDAETRRLYRTSRDGVRKYDGFLDDYAFLARALIALHEATADAAWLRHARAIAGAMADRFGDPDAGGFFFTAAGAADILVRQKTATDSPLPSGNGAAAMALLDLGDPAACRQTLAAFAGALADNGEGMSALVEAAARYVAKHEPFDVGGPAPDAAAQRPAGSGEVATDVVAVDVAWAEPTELHVRLTIRPPYHINANQSAMDLIATQLAVTGDAEAAVAGIDYPPGVERAFSFAASPVSVYEGEVTVVVRFSRPVAGSVRLALTYQACDESACLPPVTKRFEAPGAART